MERSNLEAKKFNELRDIANRRGLSIGRITKAKLIDKILADELAGKQLEKPYNLKKQEEVENSKYYTGSSPELEEDLFSDTYGEDSLVLMPISPYWLYAYWEVTDQTLLSFAKKGFDISRVYLQVCSSEENQEKGFLFSIPTEGADNWYVNVPPSTKPYKVLLGVKDKAGNFEALLTSNAVELPRDMTATIEEAQKDGIPKALETRDDEIKPADTEVAVLGDDESGSLDEVLEAEHLTASEERVFDHDTLEPQNIPEAVQETVNIPKKEKSASSLPEPALSVGDNKVSGEAEKDTPRAPEPGMAMDAKEDTGIAEEKALHLGFLNEVYQLSGGFCLVNGSLELGRGVEQRLLSEGNPLSISSPMLADSSWAFSASGRGVSGAFAPVGFGDVGPQSSYSKDIDRRKFWYMLDAKLVVYGATEPDAAVTLRGEPIKLRKDGSFAVSFTLPDGLQNIPVVFESADKVDRGTIELDVTRETKLSSD